MPINNLGYRKWLGQFSGSLLRWTSITQAGITIALKSKWIQRMLFISFLPVVYIGTAFFFFEKFMEDQSKTRQATDVIRSMRERLLEDESIPLEIREELAQQLPEGPDDERIPEELRQQIDEILNSQISRRDLPEPLRGLPNVEAVMKSLATEDSRVARHTTWCWMLMTFFRYPQGVLMLIMIGLIVPPLIARDLRSRAILIYFSRPIGRLEYLLGKVAIPATFLALITALPGMILYLFGVLLSPGFFVIADTWDIPFRIMAATAVLIIPTSLLALMYSSLTYESRFATFAWFATWGLGGGAYVVAYFTQVDMDSPSIPEISPNWSMLSIYNTVGKVQEWIFGLEPSFTRVAPLVGLLLAISLFSLVILMRRVHAPINV